jgi:hypothetical protein
MKTTMIAAAIGAMIALPALAQTHSSGTEPSQQNRGETARQNSPSTPGGGGDSINGRAGATTGSGSMGGATPRAEDRTGGDGRGAGGPSTNLPSHGGASGGVAGSSGAGAGTQGSMNPGNIQTRGSGNSIR